MGAHGERHARRRRSPDRVAGPTRAAWRDGKRYAWLLGLLVPLAPFVAWFWVEVTHVGGFWFLSPVLVFGVLPVLDLAVGVDASNPPDAVLRWLEADHYYRWCVYLYIPVQYAGLVFACRQWGGGGLTAVEGVGLAVTMGIIGGVAINTAHELGHKRERVERWLSRVALAQTGYGHFFVEHNRGHHARVATPEDPASARLGEGFWEFLPRAVGGGVASAWRLEAARLARLGKRRWSPANDIIGGWAMTAALFAALAFAYGPVVLPYLALQAVLGVTLLEVVNYLEHYGLLRQQTADGRYEGCLPRHSWNSNSAASNVLLYHLQRHADHHANPTRRYQALRHVAEAPQLPTGYMGMIVLACVPPLWRRVMDRRLLAHLGGDVTRANIHPRRRATILAKYGGGDTRPREAA